MALPLTRRVAISALRCLPRNALSRAAGHVVDLRLPPALLQRVMRLFVRVYNVNVDEMRDPLQSFGTFQQFFTRALKDGARPIDAVADSFVAPCDGSWGAAGIVEGGMLLQIKGRPYRLADLLASEEEARRFEGGAFATFYLAPRDYHRFHAPCAVRVTRATYVPGTLWPVNRMGIESIDSLFAQNERLCAYMAIDGASEGRELCLVAVGATVVGKVRVAFDFLTTNAGGKRVYSRSYTGRERLFAKGEEWGRFEIGSTIVAVAAPGVVELDVQPPGSGLRLGRRIGKIVAAVP